MSHSDHPEKFLKDVYEQTKQVVRELHNAFPLTDERLFVCGASTSEVLGERIGSGGSEAVAEAIFNAVSECRDAYGFHIAFQCCEHVNRALVVESYTARQYGLEPVSVVPHPQAGGALASHAFRNLTDAQMVEHIRADAGVDIGDTFIGMHLKPVAVPVRVSRKTIGAAHVTVAKTRPKLIGGARAIYVVEQ
jgi:uncharacterized protein (TIGR01440 family)